VVGQEKMEKALKRIEAELKDRVAYFKSKDKLIEAQRIEERTNFGYGDDAGRLDFVLE